MNPSMFFLGRSPDAEVVIIEGKGLRRQSEYLKSLFEDATEGQDENQVSDRPLVVMLDRCDYLDSTFLGGLVRLSKQNAHKETRTLRIVAGPETVKRLFGACKLQKYLPVQDSFSGRTPTQWQAVDLDQAGEDCVYHQLESHEALAELDIPQSDAFHRIAENIRKELQAREG